jgi:pantothenate kinase
MNLRKKYNIPNNAVITIAGTVGVGKSTMTNALADAVLKSKKKSLNMAAVLSKTVPFMKTPGYLQKCIMKKAR